MCLKMSVRTTWCVVTVWGPHMQLCAASTQVLYTVYAGITQVLADMAGCFLYHHMENGYWDCPGDDLDHGNYVDQGHVCVLRCRWGINNGYGGVISCLGHGVWEDDDLVGCELGLDN